MAGLVPAIHVFKVPETSRGRAAEVRQAPVAAEGAAEQRAVDKVTAVTMDLMRVVDKTA